jgi:hypothetical protein
MSLRLGGWVAESGAVGHSLIKAREGYRRKPVHVQAGGRLALIRRGLILMMAFAFLTTIASAGSSIAYVDSGTDPQEGVETDISSSRRWVRHTDEGRRLVVTVGFYSTANNNFSIKITLDSRGGHRPDFFVFADNSTGQHICRVHKYGGSHPVVSSCELRVNDPVSVQVARVRVAARDVRPDKQIRWRVMSLPLSDDSTDRAPNAGWYG